MSVICNLCRASDRELAAMLNDPEGVSDFVENASHSIDLDKAWHAIHYLLTGEAEGGSGPKAFLQEGGETIGDVDLGYGPGRAISNEQTKAFAAALNAVSEAEFRRRFDPQSMMSEMIYPEIWDRDAAEDDALGYVVQWFNALKEFVDAAATANSGLIIYYA